MTNPPRRLRWHLLGAAFVVVAVLGFWGFTQYQMAAHHVQPVAQRIYLTLQLFALESGDITGRLTWQLEVARVFAPILALYAVIQSLAIVFHEQVERWQLRRLHDHVVVIAGSGVRGTQLSGELLDRGRKVVAIVDNPGGGPAEALKEKGGLVLAGDARHLETLLKAGIERAGNLVVLCDDDRTTGEVVATVRNAALNRQGRERLSCVGVLSNPDLWTLLAVEEFQKDPGDVRVDFVNVLGAGAEAMARRYPPVAGGSPTTCAVVVTGQGPIADNVVLALARSSGFHRTMDGPLDITLFGSSAVAVADLRRRHGELDRLVTLGLPEDGRAGIRSVECVFAYVCLDGDPAGVARTLELRSLLSDSSRIVVVQRELDAVGVLLRRKTTPGGPSIEGFGLFDEICQADILLSGTSELIAQAFHRIYLQGRAESGPVDGDPSCRPWADLAEALRDSNRDQARQVIAKVKSLGRVIGPLVDWDQALAAFTPAEIEQLSELEHERWVRERERAGWRPGPRDSEKRTTPYLVPWSELSDEIQNRDRQFVRGLPALLASIGLQVLPRH